MNNDFINNSSSVVDDIEIPNFDYKDDKNDKADKYDRDNLSCTPSGRPDMGTFGCFSNAAETSVEYSPNASKRPILPIIIDGSREVQFSNGLFLIDHQSLKMLVHREITKWSKVLDGNLDRLMAPLFARVSAIEASLAVHSVPSKIVKPTPKRDRKRKTMNKSATPNLATTGMKMENPENTLTSNTDS